MHGVPLYPEVNDPPHQCRVSSDQKIVRILRTWCEAQETMKISNGRMGFFSITVSTVWISVQDLTLNMLKPDRDGPLKSPRVTRR